MTSKPSKAFEVLDILSDSGTNMVEYVEYLEELLVSDLAGGERDVAMQLIQDGWVSGTLEDLKETARKLLK